MPKKQNNAMGQSGLPPHLQFLVSCSEAARALGISKSGVYNLLRDGVLPSVRLGGRTLIRAADLEKFVAGLPSRNGGAA